MILRQWCFTCVDDRNKFESISKTKVSEIVSTADEKLKSIWIDNGEMKVNNSVIELGGIIKYT